MNGDNVYEEDYITRAINDFVSRVSAHNNYEADTDINILPAIGGALLQYFWLKG